MIKRITDVGFSNYHEERVADEVDELQKKGYEVEKIIRVSEMSFGIFGQNTTDIYFKIQ